MLHLLLYHSLNPCFNGLCSSGYVMGILESNGVVSILVLMDYVLLVPQFRPDGSEMKCLNPCFNGLCSSGMLKLNLKDLKLNVSILVLMDYVLLAKMLG